MALNSSSPQRLAYLNVASTYNHYSCVYRPCIGPYHGHIHYYPQNTGRSADFFSLVTSNVGVERHKKSELSTDSPTVCLC